MSSVLVGTASIMTAVIFSVLVGFVIVVVVTLLAPLASAVGIASVDHPFKLTSHIALSLPPLPLPSLSSSSSLVVDVAVIAADIM